MKHVLVIGCPGSGKSTFSRALAKKTGLPIYYLDMMFWNADKTVVTRDIFMERLQQVLLKDAWIIDGNYGSTMEMRIQQCDTVFFLDYPLEVCLAGVKERRGKERVDMPWIEPIGEIDEEFLDQIMNYEIRERVAVLELFQKYTNKQWHIFKKREEADAFLLEINE